MAGPADFVEAYATAESPDTELAAWMKELEPYRWREVECLEPARAALLVVDMSIPEPEIPLSWPHAVSVGRSGIYVSDFINRRVLRVEMKAGADSTCELK